VKEFQPSTVLISNNPIYSKPIQRLRGQEEAVSTGFIFNSVEFDGNIATWCRLSANSVPTWSLLGSAPNPDSISMKSMAFLDTFPEAFEA
jgi:hypothetical protein